MNKVRDGLRRHDCKCRSFVAVPRSRDLLLCAKHLLVAAISAGGASNAPEASPPGQPKGGQPRGGSPGGQGGAKLG